MKASQGCTQSELVIRVCSFWHTHTNSCVNVLTVHKCVFFRMCSCTGKCRLLSPGAGGRTRRTDRGIGHDTSIPGWEKGWENGWQWATSAVTRSHDTLATNSSVRNWWRETNVTPCCSRECCWCNARVTLISNCCSVYSVVFPENARQGVSPYLKSTVNLRRPSAIIHLL